MPPGKSSSFKMDPRCWWWETSTCSTACCTIPGSYAVELRATVTTDDKKVRRFAMMYVKRYNSPKLVAALKELSWNAMEVWPYTDGRRELLLCQRS